MTSNVIETSLERNPVVQVIAFFYISQASLPAETSSIDVRLSESDRSLAHFKKRLWKEGLQLRKLQLGIDNGILLVGYSKRQEGQCFCNFTESFTDEQWCIALSKVVNNHDFVITVKVVEAKVVSSVSEVQARVKPAVLALPNQPSDQSDQHNQDQVRIDRDYKEKPTTQQLLPASVTPSLVLDPSAVLSIDTEGYYGDSSNVIETEEQRSLE